MISKLAAWSARILPASFKKQLYRLGPVSNWIRKILNKNLPLGMTRIEVSAGPLAGATLELDLQQQKDYWLGTYETEFLNALEDWVKPGSVVYDAGANIGYLSLCLARLTGENGQVIAFEAMPDMLDRLHINLDLNPEGRRVRVIHSAVTDRSGKTIFKIGPSGGTGKVEGAAGRQLEYRKMIEVQAVSLDDVVFVFNNPAPQFIKMDIEGGEVLAFLGMERILSDIRPVLAVELHGKEAATTAWEACQRFGYAIRRVSHGYPVVDSLQEMDWKEYILAVPDVR